MSHALFAMLTLLTLPLVACGKGGDDGVGGSSTSTASSSVSSSTGCDYRLEVLQGLTDVCALPCDGTMQGSQFKYCTTTCDPSAPSCPANHSCVQPVAGLGSSYCQLRCGTNPPLSCPPNMVCRGDSSGDYCYPM